MARAQLSSDGRSLAAAFGGVGPPGARQIVRLHVERVQTSCGYGVPRFDYRGRREKNAVSIDGLPTGLADAG